MLNTYKDCKASFCSSLSVSHLSKRTFLLFLLFLFYFTYLNALFLKSPPSASLFLCFSFLPLLSSLVSTCHPHAAEFKVTGHSFPSLNLGLFLRFPLTTNSMHTHKQKEAHTFSSLQSLFHLQVWIDKFDDFLIVLIYERGEKKKKQWGLGDWKRE